MWVCTPGSFIHLHAVAVEFEREGLVALRRSRELCRPQFQFGAAASAGSEVRRLEGTGDRRSCWVGGSQVQEVKHTQRVVCSWLWTRTLVKLVWFKVFENSVVDGVCRWGLSRSRCGMK